MAETYPIIASADYDAVYPQPLTLKAGEIVTPTRWDDEWPGWTWVCTRAGLGGWVPEYYLDRGGRETVCLYDYDGTELSFRIGDRLEVLQTILGWHWCRDSRGQCGWVPSNRVRPVR